MAVTRIKNNQITDSTITYTKIAPGTLVGSVFNANLTLNSNVSIIGNLTVSGTTSTVSSTNTYVNDPVVVFNNGYTGSLTGYDIGILVNRNLSSLPGYGSVNTALVWSEADAAFLALATTDTGTGVTSLNNSGFVNLKVGNVTAATGAFSGTGTFTGGLQNTAIGSVTPSTAAFTTVTASGTVALTSATAATSPATGALVVTGGVGIGGNLYVQGNTNIISGNVTLTNSAFFVGNAQTGFNAIYAGIPSGYTILPQTVAQFSSNANTYAQINAQNISSGSAATTDYIATANNGNDLTYYIDFGITGSNYDPTNPFNSMGTSLSANDAYLYSQGNLSTTPGGNLIIGTNTVGRVVRIISGGHDAANVVAVFNAPGTTSSSTTTGALVVTGGIGSSGTITAASVTVAAGGLLSAPAGTVTTLTATNFSSGNIVGVLTGTASTANVGIYGSVTASTTNATFYPTFTDRSTTGNSASYVNSSFTYNPSTTALSSPIVNATSATAATSTSTGALVVTGGAGVGGSLYVGQNLVVTGNLTVNGSVTTVNTATMDVTDINITVAKGAASAAAANGAGLTVDGAAATILYTSATDSWNFNKQVIGQFTTSNLQSTGGAITGMTGAFSTLQATNFSTGNAQINGGNSAWTTLTATNFSTGNAQINGGNSAWTTSVSTNFSSGNARISGGYADNFPIGANTAATGRFTTLATTSTSTLAGNVVITSASDTVNTTTGALVLTGAGGLSVGGNAYVGNNLYIGSSAFSQNLTAPTIIAVDASSTYTQMALKNTSTNGSADFVAYGDNGTDTAGWADMGFTSSVFNDANYTITKPNDGYFIVRPASAAFGGNLVLATSEAGSYNDIVIGVGSFASSAEVARFHGNASNNGTFVVKLPTNNTLTANTGAMQVWGGASFSGNVYVDDAMMINGSKTAGYDFLVRGKTDNTLIWARPGATYDQVLIGNSAVVANLVTGAKLQINSTDSMIIPVGTSAQRPGSSGGTDAPGMIRYNTTLNTFEYYGGATPGWQQLTSQFTVIADDQFSGDGVTTAFTLTTSQTTNGCIVSINGVIQIPTVAYSVTGSTLTFTEAPANGDLIDVRKLTTTQVVTQIASQNGYNVYSADNTGLQFYTGSSSQTLQYTLDNSGAWVTQRANVSVAAANTPTGVDAFATATYRSAKYVIQATAAGQYQTMEALVIHDDTTPTIVTYGVVQTGGNLGVLSASIAGGTMTLNFIAANASTNVRIRKEYTLI